MTSKIEATLVAVLALAMACLALPVEAFGQVSETIEALPPPPRPIPATGAEREVQASPLGVLFADGNADGTFDRDGDYVSAVGVLTSGVLTAGGLNVVRIQDATRGAVIIMVSREPVFEHFQADDLVQVWGRIQGADGLPLIYADSLRQVGKAPPVAASDVRVADLHGGARLGMRVRLSGRLAATPDGPEDARLTDGTGSIDIRFQEDFEPTPELVEALESGRRATLIAYPMPTPSGARLSVDRVEDIVLRPEPPYALAASALAVVAFLAMGWGIAAKHRATVRRNREQAELIARLEDTQEVLERSRAEVTQSEARYRSLVDNAPFGLFLTDGRGGVEDANPALLEMLGYPGRDELVGRSIGEVLHRGPGTWTEFAGRILRSGQGPQEATWATRDGGRIRVLVGLRLVPGRGDGLTLVEGYVENVDDRQRLEDQLRQAQKMEAVGRLAGGVAHDFNNLLTVVLASTDFLLMDLSEGENREEVERIRVAAKRAASLTHQLLAFSRKQPLQPRVVEVNAVVGEAMKLVTRLVEENVEVESVVDPGAGSVEVDPGQLQQVLLNLVVNARDAMPSGGRLTVRTGTARVAGRSPEGTDLLPGDYVVISVGDTGSGMSEETKRHLFEPFFTTKEMGRGTGLGLATVYGIVKQSRGYIYADSTEGAGTTFTIYLPRTRSLEGEGTGLAAEGERVAGGQGTILLVEDQPDVRTLVRKTLQRNGYETIEAGDGEEALRALDGHPGAISAVVTDVVMPHMSGREFADELSIRRPGTKVLFMSGYTDDVVFARGAVERNEAFLRKPFTTGLLLDSVKSLLEGSEKKLPRQDSNLRPAD